MKKRRSKVSIIYHIILFIYFDVLFFGTVTSSVVFSLSGFAITEDGTIYIGRDHVIDVIVEGDSVTSKRMYNYTVHGYCLSSEDEQIILYTGSCVYRFDRSLELLENSL